MKEKPSYFTKLPASVRYCKDITFFERILYSEILALSQAKGFCFASNNHFSELYQVSIWTVSSGIKKLIELKFIKSSINKEKGNKRTLTPIVKNHNSYCEKSQDPIVKNHNSYCEKSQDPIVKNHKHNNTSINTDNLIDKINTPIPPQGVGESGEIFSQFLSFFSDSYEKSSGSKYFYEQQRDGKKIEMLCEKINFTLQSKNKSNPSENEILTFWKSLLDNLPDSYKGADLSVIERKYNNIISKINMNQNGKSTTNSNRQESIFNPYV